MSSSFTIPVTTLAVGSRTFGPASIPDADVKIILTIDRTVAGGLNSLDTASTLDIDAQESLDGGVTWQDLGTSGTVGGPGGGKNPGSSTEVLTLIPGTGRRLQAITTVGGPSSIAVAGSIATQ